MSQGTEEVDDITFIDWKGVDEHRDPIDPTVLSDNFVVVFPEATSLLNYRL